MIGICARPVSSNGILNPAAASNLAQKVLERNENAPHETLTRRESKILALLATGLTVTEIAERLQLSVKRIKTYRARMLKKMGFRTNAELIRYAILNRIIN